MKRNFLTGTGEKVSYLFGGCSSCAILSGGNDACSEGHETGNCQKHEKLFHNCFCVFEIINCVKV